MRKIFILILLVLIFCTGIITYLYAKLYYLPEWYVRADKESVNQLLNQSKQLRRNITRRMDTNAKVEFSSHDLTLLILSEIKKKSPVSISTAIKSMHTEIMEEVILIDMIIDLNHLQRQNFSGRTYRFINWAKDWLPENICSNFYIRFEIIPSQFQDSIDLSQRSTIQIAGLDFPVEEVLNQIGFEKYFIKTNWNFRELNLYSNKLVLRD